MARIVVTGGAGFIGSSIAEAVARDNELVIIDDLSTGNARNISSLLQKPNVRFVKASILDTDMLQEALANADFVFHEAAIPSVPRSIQDPLPTNEVNVRGTLNVLMAARANRVKKVVMASSSSVYGDTPTLPKEESMIPNPLSPYAATKIMGEHYCQVFQKAYGLQTACLRYFNVYGPHQDPHSEYAAVIPKFISCIGRGEPPNIYGDGFQTRDFTYVQDVVGANLLMIQGGATGVYNVGGGSRISINDLVKTLATIMGKDVTPTYLAPRAGDIMHSLASIERARSIGYEPRYSLEAGLRETVSWFSS